MSKCGGIENGIMELETGPEALEMEDTRESFRKCFSRLWQRLLFAYRGFLAHSSLLSDPSIARGNPLGKSKCFFHVLLGLGPRRIL